MDGIRWFHKVPLGDGRVTPGVSDVHGAEGRYLFDRIPFRGRSVLDIGAWDGYFSFRAEQEGAARVVALDDPDLRWGGLAGFEFLKAHFRSAVEWRKGNVFALPEERFDVVLCYGVLYHLNDPLTALSNCFRRANERVVMEGLVFAEDEPLMRLIPPGAIRGDDSNFYSVSTGYLALVAELNGFEIEATRLRDRWRRVLPMSARAAGQCRGAVLFRRTREVELGYRQGCYSVPPVPFLRA